VVQRGERLTLRVALTEGGSPGEVATRLRERVAGRLADLGVRSPDVEVELCDALEVELCDALERPPSGKVQVVVAESPASASSVRSTSSAVV
jgi:hypothetical protein